MERNNQGFTLLEVMIAIAIMVIAFTSILIIQSSSLKATERARHLTIVAMLAREKMIDAEHEFEGKAFNEVDETKEGTFDAPFSEFSWKREIKEVEFPSLGGGSFSGNGGGENSDDDAVGGDGGGGNNSQADSIAKAVSKYISKSLREVNVTISWKAGKSLKTYSLSTYWVDFGNEISF